MTASSFLGTAFPIHHPGSLRNARRAGFLAFALVAIAWTARGAPPASRSRPDAEAVPERALDLSPFVVKEEAGQGYYASQTLTGGRLRQDLRDLSAAIQVVTREMLDDLAATGADELFQYTTGTEVGGILGNFTGASDNSGGDVSTGEARRNPDGTTRVRGLSAPNRARNFFKTDIPFDSYNTERIDINRGANSFLFGLGSPSGFVNTGLVRARFRDTNEISTRIGSGGGGTPSYRASFAINRVLIKNHLALHAASLADRTRYRQEPTYKDDDRLYLAATWRPFGDGATVLQAHVETGRIRGNASDVLLPQQNLGVFLDDPVVGRLSVNAYENLQRFNHVEGPTQAQYNALSAADKLRFRVRDTPTVASLAGANWGNGAYGLVFDGANGRLPSFAYTDQYRAVDYAARDPFFGPGRAGKGAPNNVYHGNLRDINGAGWLSQGFTNLDTFDFSRANLAWDNDYFTRDFSNTSVSLERTFLHNRAGFEIAFDYQDLYRRDFVAFNAAVSEIMFDINETLWLPADPNYRASGVSAPVRNPNYGRPFILTKAARRTNDSQREAFRATAFLSHDFADSSGSALLGKLLGRHTLTAIVDRSVFDERVINYSLNSFGDPEPALHIGPANARQTSNAPRAVPIMAYIGPAQPQAFTDPAFTLADFKIQPATYQLWPDAGYSIRKLSWNLGPDATAATLGLDSRANGNEGFVWGSFEPREVPTKNYRLQRTKSESQSLNAQSHFLGGALVLNSGVRQDTVSTWLNTEAPLLGADEIPDLSPAAFRVEDGLFSRTRERIFGGGAVWHLPPGWLRLLPDATLSLHVGASENFVPAIDRVDQYRRPIASPKGATREYGATIGLLGGRLTARLNWFVTRIDGASTAVSDLFNTINTNIFNHYGMLNRDLLRLDADNDGALDASLRSQVSVNPATGLTPEGLTVDQALATAYPGFPLLRAARAALEPYLDGTLREAYNYRMAADGTSLTQFAGAIADTNDIEARGFEAEIVFNPTRRWRLAFNASHQKTTLTNIAPRLTALLETLWLPHLAKYGGLDWNAPAEAVSGNTTREQINAQILDYLVLKAQEGRAQAEQRPWRFNAITRYQFDSGWLRGVSLGGTVRWEDRCAIGYPMVDDPRGIQVPDINHPYLSDTETSVDLLLGYRRRIFGGRDWSAQLNLRNLQNIGCDAVSAVRSQPDGSIARARFDPPFQVWLTNTFRF